MFSSQNSQVSSDVNYIEDVFSAWLYTGNGSTQTITNGIDLSTKGGLVWVKSRTNAFADHALSDTANGTGKYLSSNTTSAQTTTGNNLTSFNADGFTVGSRTEFNQTSANLASWTFRKQPKFFDVVTYTGNGSTLTVSHNLGSVPGCIIVKKTSGAEDWYVWHTSLAAQGPNYTLNLNTTSARTNGAVFGGSSLPPTSTDFSVGPGVSVTNGAGETYVAYLFASNAGGFGLTGTDNVISCGSYTGTGSSTGPTVDLGYEPQWLLVKKASGSQDWFVFDNMRGVATGGNDYYLRPNSKDAETTGGDTLTFTATGFIPLGSFDLNTSGTYIYIAIRRGPMKVPTSGTSVFSPTAWTGSSATRNTTTGFVTDLNISRMRQNFSSGDNLGAYWESRLTGATQYLHSDSTAAEASQTDGLTSFASNTGLTFGADSTVQAWNYDNNYRNWSFKRAPSYMDVVCYTGTGSATSFSHNLQAVPELMIVKRRNATNNWAVYSSALGNTNRVFLNQTQASASDSTLWNNTTPTSSVFTVGTAFATNNSGDTYVAYLFATCAGVSKVGSYTGNGSSQTINCGFTAGARFVMVKATSTTGNWICVDTNGINAGVDRALYMNNADLEDFTYDWIDIDSTGFIVNETSTIAANTNGVTYIFLAVA